MNRALFFFLILLFFGACQPESQLSISNEKMIAVLVDVHVAEAAMQNLSNNQKDSIAQVYYGQIYQIHGLTKEQFAADIDYVTHHPKLMENLYSKVLENLGKREAETQTEQSDENK